MAVPGVLVVEDNTDIRETLVEILEGEGFEALGVPNGAVALDTLRSAQRLPALILLDLMMPVMDGMTFREEQLRIPELAEIPVVALSAQRDLVDTARALSVTDFLKKPLQLDELLGIARRYCSQDPGQDEGG